MNKYIILILLVFSACSVNHKEIDLRVKYLNNKIELKKINSSKKSIFFIGVRHIGTKTYYEELKFKVDSMQSIGYKFLYEGAELNRYSKLLTNEDLVYYLKFRKIIGYNIFLPYSKIPPFSNYVEKFKLIDQPSYSELKLTNSNSESADLTIEQLIKEYELIYKAIELEECDLKTKLNEKFQCNLVDELSRKTFNKEFIHDKRNELLVNKVLKDKSDKLVIIYGLNHFNAVKEYLENNQ